VQHLPRDDGGGTDRAPGLLSAEVQTQTDGALLWKITSGNTHAGMPAFSFLPEAQPSASALPRERLSIGLDRVSHADCHLPRERMGPITATAVCAESLVTALVSRDLAAGPSVAK